MNRITAMYFSPTNTSKAITDAIARGLGGETKSIDLTRPSAREKIYHFDENDILVLGYPVYGGRIPVILMETLQNLKGAGTLAVLAAVYGNRAYEDALVEGQDILVENGFTVIAAGAFIGEHSYTEKVGTGRPDAEDLHVAADFGEQIGKKLEAGQTGQIAVKGNRPYKDAMGPMPFKPVTTDSCNNCGRCAEKCPVGIISRQDAKIVADGCVLCAACVKVCPEHAKHIDAEPILKIKNMLESKCTDRKKPELFL